MSTSPFFSVKKLLVMFTTLSFLFLSGCSSKSSPGNYDVSEIGKVNKVVPGVIISMRPVNIRNAEGSSLAVPDNSNLVNTPDANNVYVDSNANHGFEYIIKLNSGAIVSVVQVEDLHLKVNQKILVIYGRTIRVVADEGKIDS